ncbi:MAG: TetM/TetW/TetO/TetS family tetracycline resistance ribosomal protection protein [Oscillospiraceae bacterium]|nr:TetM/TetW/TetO/TetS family tetracycline resistance ribosomal protection protein [Oscillospiraceae bacterium]
MRQLILGVLAHVDAGKTTLSEALLYTSGAIRTLGRVDHRDAHLDTDTLERERGITIFSKQARFPLSDGTAVTLLDTPGHVDFSAEMERTLQVLDAAVLVISGTDGVQAHTETLWRLLKRYRVPTLIFVTKMDLALQPREAIMAQLQKLDTACVDFSDAESRTEQAAMLDEGALEAYLADGTLSDARVRALIASRTVFPVWFGSGLKLTGVEDFIADLTRFAPQPEYSEAFGAQVFQILHDAQGARLTCLKVTGGALRVRDAISYLPKGADEPVTEKATQLRLYSGARFEQTELIPAGGVAAVQGLTQTYPGQSIGDAAEAMQPVLEPVMFYRIVPPADMDAQRLFRKLRELEEEDPLLHLVWDEDAGEIRVQLMGAVQIEVLQRRILDRYDADVRIDSGRIVYQETVAAPVEGVGHFEPLRHYAEVHLAIEPAPRGTGVTLTTACSEDMLDRNWQRLILTHLAEKTHRGVLTGAPLTDVKITLLAGRAHAKHTEGGDFREATYRAVRQGLMRAESLLLEPQYAFRLTVPTETVGRAISDIRQMGGTFSGPEPEGDESVLTGRVRVAAMQNYAAELAAYTRGRGRLVLSVDGYDVCRDANRVIAEIGYDPERDTRNPSGSVFCSHGAGTVIPWDQVRDYMHLDTGYLREKAPPPQPRIFRRNFDLDDRELEEILQREFGPIRRRQYSAPVVNSAEDPAELFHAKKQRLIVDGYNVIFAWDELKSLARMDLSQARERLMDMLSNFAGFTKAELVVVFDGYRVKGSAGERFDWHNIHVAYTKENETADAYIEWLANEIGKNESVRVVTSDSLIRLSALRSGVLRTSAMEFHAEVAGVNARIEQAIRDLNRG